MTAATVAALRAAWRKAHTALDLAPDMGSGWTRAYTAEQVAWDKFRDACDELNGENCDHPECPHPTFDADGVRTD